MGSRGPTVNFIKLGQSVRFPVVFSMLLVKDDIYVKKIKRIMVAIDSSEAAKQCLRLALFHAILEVG